MLKYLASDKCLIYCKIKIKLRYAFHRIDDILTLY